MKRKSCSLIIILMLTLAGCRSNLSDILLSDENLTEISLTLYGEKDTVVNFGGMYIDDGVKAVDNGNDVSELVMIDSNLDTEKIGNYTITYAYMNEKAVRNIQVIDTEPPVMKLVGYNHMFLPMGIEYEEAGYSAIDNYDGDITYKVEVINNADTSELGEYTVTYRIEDSSGNCTEMQRKISVVDSPLSDDLADFSLEGLFTNTIIPETILSDEELKKYMEGTIIIGDSRACYFIWYGFIPKTNVLGNTSLHPMNIFEREINNYETEELMSTLEYISNNKPKRVIFSMGIDCVGTYPMENIVEEYTKFLNMAIDASPDTTFIIHNVMPVNGRLDYEEYEVWMPDNEKINRLNYYLVQMCEDLGIYYLDSHKVLKNEFGYGIPWYFIDDMIHLSKMGQEKVFEYIKTHPVIE